jgi:hypothetical protein
MGKMTKEYKILVRNYEGNIPFARPRGRWEDHITTEVRETG